MIDSHTHLDDEKFDADREEIIRNFTADDIDSVICCGTNLNSCKAAIELAQKHEKIYAAIGIHPHEAKYYDKEFELFLFNNGNHPKVVAIGEIGLEHHYNFSDDKSQKSALEKQIIIAYKLKLPMIFHMREASADFIQILKENKQYLTYSGVVHCFSGSLEIANELINMGFYLSFSGDITFKNAKNKIEIIKNISLNKILVETDCPYLTPEPLRGQRNEPKNVAYVAKKIAEIKELTLAEVVAQTNENVLRLFKKIRKV